MELRVFLRRKQLRVPQLHMREHAADGDVGLRHVAVDEPWAPAIALELGKPRLDLRQQALFVVLVESLGAVEITLVENGDDLVGNAGRDRHGLKHAPPLWAMGWSQRPGWPRLVVEIIEDGTGVDQCLAILGDER